MNPVGHFFYLLTWCHMDYTVAKQWSSNGHKLLLHHKHWLWTLGIQIRAREKQEHCVIYDEEVH